MSNPHATAPASPTVAARPATSVSLTARAAVTDMGTEPEFGPDFVVPQHWDRYSPEEHSVWDTLYARQAELLPGRAAPEFLAGLAALNLNRGGIPDFEVVNRELRALTGWTIVAVPCLVPDAIFFEHLANRRFPAGRFIRKGHELDYIEEPDVFHDVFGHVPMLTNPVFADYMEAYGRGGLRSAGFDALPNLARLYWYTVEFGLIRRPEGLRIYGAGIVSSHAETIFALESPAPNRVHFNLERVMRTRYRIDDFQQTYCVIDSFEELFDATYQDFAALYARLPDLPAFAPAEITADDKVWHHGDQSYANAGGRLNTRAPTPPA